MPKVRRQVRLRPQLPKLDWLLFPNMLAYAMSWYGLFLGKYPFQVLCTALGMCAVFSAGLYRIKIANLKPEDYLPTDSRSNRERLQTILFDLDDKDDPVIAPSVLYPTVQHPALSLWLLKNNSSSSNSSKIRRYSSLLGEDDPTVENDTPARKKRQTYPDAHGNAQNCRVASVLVVAKRNTSDPSGRVYNIFNRTILAEVERMEDVIFNITVEVYSPKSGDGGSYYYGDRGPSSFHNSLCTKQPSGECGGFNLRVMRSLVPTTIKDPIALVLSRIPGIGLTYPHYFTYDLSQFFGGVEIDSEGYVERLEAMRQVYCLNEYQVDWFIRTFKVWITWENAFDRTLRLFQSEYFDVYWSAEYQKEAEQMALVTNMLPKVGATFVALMLWCTVGALMGDAVRSKPWAGAVGIAATLLANTAGFGISLWIDPTFWPILMAVPLLTLAIGLDDMFIILEAYSRTSPSLPVEERMMLSMNIGGTSIFITFVINVLDFIIGTYTPFPIISTLSNFATATMVLDFFFQMTIFCSCLALFGTAERDNRHACVCCVQIPRRQAKLCAVKEKHAQQPSNVSLLCCAGGNCDDDENNHSHHETKTTSNGNGHATPSNGRPAGVLRDHGVNHASETLAEKIAHLPSRFLLTFPVRLISCVIFVCYVGLSIWSITQLKDGLKPERIYRKSSNLYDYAYHQRILFTRYSHEVLLVVSNEVDYSTAQTQRYVIDMLDKIESSGYFWGKDETKCWLRDMLGWAAVHNISVTGVGPTEFIWQMRRYPGGFLSSGSYGLHSRDLKLDPNSTAIKRARFRFRCKDMTDPTRQINMMQSIRNIVDSYKPQFDMAAYTGDFQLYDQFLTARPATLYYSAITLAVTLGVAIFMIPHPVCLFWVAIFVVTILIGIVGLMRLWDMDLDSVTLINLLIAISLSSDYIAHGTYIFLITPVKTIPPKKPRRSADGTEVRPPPPAPLTGSQIRLAKARALVDEVSVSAIPASIGTIMSVIAMSTSDAYIFMTFFRIMFLTVVLSIIHALVFVPTILSFFGPTSSGVVADVKVTGGESAQRPGSNGSIPMDTFAPGEVDPNSPTTPNGDSMGFSEGFRRRRRRPALYTGSSLRSIYPPPSMDNAAIEANFQEEEIEDGDDEIIVPTTVRAVPISNGRKLSAGTIGEEGGMMNPSFSMSSLVQQSTLQIVEQNTDLLTSSRANRSNVDQQHRHRFNL